VFVVASAREDFNPAEVLFEFEGVRRDTAPSRQAREEVAGTIAARFGISRNNHEECVATPEYLGNAEGGAREVPFLTCHNTGGTAGISNQTPLVGSYTPSSIGEPGDPCPTLTKAHSHAVAQPAYAIQGSMIGRNDNAGPQGDGINEELCFTQNTINRHAVANNMAVRRLTPTECERLQGFPDGYTNIPWRKAAESPDGPRYKALGNSWAVPVVRWIGQRIQDQINVA
jgi:DNA (cytosine-5)-methyltransferase 1